MEKSNLQIVREAVIKAVPEIVELKLGCEVEFLLGDWYGETGYVTYECSKCPKHKLYKNCGAECEPDEAVVVVTGIDDEPREWILLQGGKDFKTIGHPIRLADVMVALRSKSHGGYAIDQDGLFIRIMKNHRYGWNPMEGYATPPCWNIYKDDLTLQSEWTLGFLADLLK